MNRFFFSLIIIASFLEYGWANPESKPAKKKNKAKIENQIENKVFQKGSTLSQIATLDLSAPEISAYMPQEKKLFVVGGESNIDVINLADVNQSEVQTHLALDGKATSVAVFGDFVAVSMTADFDYKPGFVQLFLYNDGLISVGKYQVCNLPDMITFTKDGSHLLVACEGSPSEDFSEDPEGAIAVLKITATKSKFKPEVSVKIADFKSLDTTAALNAGVRKIGIGNFYQAMEPEYITVSEDSKTAWVSLQENNAIAKINIDAAKITDIYPLGYVDHSKPHFGLDAKKDGKIKIKNYPIRGLRQPDGIASFSAYGKSYVITANEGAPVNDYSAWTDETKILMLLEQKRLDENVFDSKMQADLRNFTVSNFERCDKGENPIVGGACPYVYGFGSRSVSIFDAESFNLIWESGDLFEQTIAKIAPDYFNWNAKKNKVKMDARSEDKGCEPENVTVGIVNGKRYAFIGLERTSGIMVLDITNASSPQLVDFYLNPSHRGPEGLLFIDAKESPIPGQALLVVGYEYSKTLVIYKVN